MVHLIAKKPVKFDLLDRKIFLHLHIDARCNRKHLAKRLKISLQKLQYRIYRLEKELLSPIAAFNFPKLGFKSYILLVERFSADFKKLFSSPHTYFVNHTLGKYELVIHIVGIDPLEFCKEYLSFVHPLVFPINVYQPDTHNPYGLKLPELPVKNPDSYKFDRSDFAILSYISKDPHAKISTIAVNLRMDRGNVKKRLRKLVFHDYIQKFNYVVNPFVYNFEMYILIIRCSAQSYTKINSLVFLNKYSGFSYHSHNVIFLQYHPENYNQLRDLIIEMRKIDSFVHIDILRVAGNSYYTPIPGFISNYFLDKSKKR